MRICDLKQKEVINICDCKRLGFVCDIEFDCATGRITAIVVPGIGKICGLFGRDTEFIIPFCKICQIGPDIILVDIREEEVLNQCRGS
ncbi:MAG: YlmC/YmxH family sporulation protein [Lachnospiraceae bacterium]|nr:YlmC/YmxH family sporulation protein [Lachnospiraceae bacterium]